MTQTNIVIKSQSNITIYDIRFHTVALIFIKYYVIISIYRI